MRQRPGFCSAIIIGMFIFYVNNLNKDCYDIKQFLADNKIPTISCFPVKLWMQRYKLTMGHDSSYVKLDDKDKIWLRSLWPKGVILREWKFSKSNKNGEQDKKINYTYMSLV